MRHGFQNVFGSGSRKSTPGSSFNEMKSLPSASPSISSSQRSKERMKPRPALMWGTDPMQVLFFGTLDKTDINDPKFQYESLSKDYIRRRLLPIFPIEELDGRRAIITKSKTNRPATIVDSYLVLIPVIVVVDRNTYWSEITDEFIEKDDLDYINKLLLEILLEENEEQTQNIRNLCTSNNDDEDNDDKFLLSTTSFFSNQYVSSPSSSSLRNISIVGNFKTVVRVKSIIVVCYTFFFCFR
jgi:hypothetical protein